VEKAAVSKQQFAVCGQRFCTAPRGHEGLGGALFSLIVFPIVGFPLFSQGGQEVLGAQAQLLILSNLQIFCFLSISHRAVEGDMECYDSGGLGTITRPATMTP